MAKKNTSNSAILPGANKVAYFSLQTNGKTQLAGLAEA